MRIGVAVNVMLEDELRVVGPYIGIPTAKPRMIVINDGVANEVSFDVQFRNARQSNEVIAPRLPRREVQSFFRGVGFIVGRRQLLRGVCEQPFDDAVYVNADFSGG